jgi:NADPH:quinone reductase-like Zn-dependent oxidoreductase
VKALVQDRYGDADGLEIRDVPVPDVGDGDVLVRIEAAAINMADWHLMTGTPRMMRLMLGLRTPPRPIPGSDFAGVVEAVGSAVTDLAIGDEVFGHTVGGACAEYVSTPADLVLRRPVGASAEESACLGVAPITALQGLRDKARLQPGEHVLIVGASGGVGTFAIQVARHLGATVTAVCSTGNVEQARRLGADHVVDYLTDDIVQHARDQRLRYDVIFDNPGNRRLGELRSILQPTGRYLMVGGPKGGWVAPLPRLVGGLLRWLFVGQKFITFTANETRDDLLALRDLSEAGAIRSVVSSRYRLDEAAEALRQQGDGHTSGKIVVLAT